MNMAETSQDMPVIFLIIWFMQTFWMNDMGISI